MQTVSADPSPTRPNPIDRVWRLLTGQRAASLLLSLLALTLLVGLVLPQMPGELAQDDMAARWLAETGNRYGPLGRLLQAAGFFDIRHSAWLSGLLGAFAFIILLRLADSAGDSLRRLGQAAPAAWTGIARRWPLQSSLQLSGDLDAALDELGKDLRSEGWRVGTLIDDAGAHLSAERSALSLLALPALYAGLLLLLAGLWLGQVFGWQEAGLTLAPGEQTQLARDDQLSLSLIRQADGSQAVAAGPVDGPLTVRPFSARGSVRVQGITVRRTGEGLALVVDAASQSGDKIQLQRLEDQAALQYTLNLIFDQPRAERVFLAPSRQLAFSVVAFPALPERGFSGPTFLVQAFQVGRRDPLVNQFVEGDASLTIEGDRYDLQAGQYVTVRASRDPGAWVTAAGGLLALLSLLLSIWQPQGQLDLHLQRQRGGMISASASLRPSPLWREAERWLAAWSATYESGAERAS